MKKIIKIQFYILLLGTLFAWTNFAIEFFNWIGQKPSASCPIGSATGNPFLSSCFYGAIVFTVAFALSAILLKKAPAEHN